MKIIRILGKGVVVYSATCAVAVLIGMGLAMVLPFDVAMGVSLLVGCVIGGLGTAVFVHWCGLLAKPEPPVRPAWERYTETCADTHSFDRERPHPRGYTPSNPEGFESRVAAAKRRDPDFNEAAYRCMGPDRYWNAVARREDRKNREAADNG